MLILFIQFNGFQCFANQDSTNYRNNIRNYNSDDKNQQKEIEDYLSNNKDIGFKILIEELENTQDSSKFYFLPKFFAKVFKFTEFYNKYGKLKINDRIKKGIIYVITCSYYIEGKRYKDFESNTMDDFPIKALNELCQYTDYNLFYFGEYAHKVKTTNLAKESNFLIKLAFGKTSFFLNDKVDWNGKEITSENKLSFEEMTSIQKIKEIEKWFKLKKGIVYWDTVNFCYQEPIEPFVFSRTEISEIMKKKNEIDEYCTRFYENEFKKYRFQSKELLSISSICNGKEVITSKFDSLIAFDRYNTLHSVLEHLNTIKDTSLVISFSMILPKYYDFDTLITFIENSSLDRNIKDLMNVFMFPFSYMNLDGIKRINISNCYLCSFVRAIGNDSLHIIGRYRAHDPAELKDIAEGTLPILIISVPSMKATEKYRFNEYFPNAQSKMLFYQRILNQAFDRLKWNSRSMTFDYE